MTKSILFSSLSAFLAVLGLSCNVWAIDTNSLSHDTTHTLELKPSSLSFQLAKITFLPDALKMP